MPEGVKMSGPNGASQLIQDQESSSIRPLTGGGRLFKRAFNAESLLASTMISGVLISQRSLSVQAVQLIADRFSQMKPFPILLSFNIWQLHGQFTWIHTPGLGSEPHSIHAAELPWELRASSAIQVHQSCLHGDLSTWLGIKALPHSRYGSFPSAT